MKCLSILVLGGIMLFAGCTKNPESVSNDPDPLPPVGTKALFAADSVGGVGFSGVVDASDVVSGYTPNSYFCRITDQTSIRSVHNDNNGTFVYVILEENSREDRESNAKTTPAFRPCGKGAIIKMHANDFKQSLEYLKTIESREQEEHEAQKKIREELLKQR